LIDIIDLNNNPNISNSNNNSNTNNSRNDHSNTSGAMNYDSFNNTINTEIPQDLKLFLLQIGVEHQN